MLSKKGFTLMEVIIITLIIAALALLVVPSFKNSALTNQVEKAKVGLIELTTAVKLYNEDHTVPMTGVLNVSNFDSLTQAGPSGYAYLLHGERWAPRSGSNDYSLRDNNGVLNCQYIIGDSQDNNILASVKCKFNKIDEAGTLCYRFYIQRNNPALIKKQGPDSSEVTCDDL